MNYSHMRAYANGALDGYNTGSENNPYAPEEKPQENQAYKLGYDYGVFLYCQDMEGAEA
jgi:hypothetical protein